MASFYGVRSRIPQYAVSPRERTPIGSIFRKRLDVRPRPFRQRRAVLDFEEIPQILFQTVRRHEVHVLDLEPTQTLLDFRELLLPPVHPVTQADLGELEKHTAHSDDQQPKRGDQGLEYHLVFLHRVLRFAKGPKQFRKGAEQTTGDSCRS